MKAGLIWCAAGLIFSPLTLGFGGTCEVFQGHCEDVKVFYHAACRGEALPSVLLTLAGLIKSVREMLVESMTQPCLN